MNEPAEGLRAVIYARISRDDGNAAGAGPIERQLEDCRMLSRLRRYEVVAEEEDRGVSAYGKKERPAWERVLGMVERGEVDVVVAWHIDRMTRNMVDLERLILLTEKQGVGVATVTGDIDLTNESGKMVARILAAVARAEVERKAARQKRANLARREEGQPWKSGWRSFGYTLEGEVIDEEASLIREAAADVLTGTPLREIARRWRTVGVSTPRSDKGAEGWTHQGVRSILLNPKNAAYMTYQGEVIGDGAWEPILDRETHALLSAKLTDPARNSNGARGAGPAPVTLLSGIATCAECGEPVTARTTSIQKKQNGKRVTVGRKPIYSCPGYHIALERDSVDNLIVNSFRMITTVMLPGLVLSIPKQGTDAGVMQALEAERVKLEELADSYSAGRIPLRVLESASADIEKRVTELESALHTDADYDPRKLNSESLRQFAEMDTAGKRAVLKRVTRIRLGRKRKGQKVLECLAMDVKTTNPATGSIDWTPYLTAVDADDKRTHDPLVEALVIEQPEGVDTLAKAAAWLSETGRTDKRPSGLTSKLSPLVRFDRATGAWVSKQPVVT